MIWNENFRTQLKKAQPIVLGPYSRPWNKCEVENATVDSIDAVIRGNKVSFERSEVKNNVVLKMIV